MTEVESGQYSTRAAWMECNETWENMKYPKWQSGKDERPQVVPLSVTKRTSYNRLEIFERHGGYCDRGAVALIKSMKKWLPRGESAR